MFEMDGNFHSWGNVERGKEGWQGIVILLLSRVKRSEGRVEINRSGVLD